MALAIIMLSQIVCLDPEGVTDGKILSLIGMAKPVIRTADLEDERLQYILNK